MVLYLVCEKKNVLEEKRMFWKKKESFKGGKDEGVILGLSPALYNVQLVFEKRGIEKGNVL